MFSRPIKPWGYGTWWRGNKRKERLEEKTRMRQAFNQAFKVIVIDRKAKLPKGLKHGYEFFVHKGEIYYSAPMIYGLFLQVWPEGYPTPTKEQMLRFIREANLKREEFRTLGGVRVMYSTVQE